MNINAAKELGQIIVGTLVKIAETTEPAAFQAYFIGAIIANVVGNLPDEYWRDFQTVEPCDVPGCDCHVMKPALIAALNALRNDHKNTVHIKP